MSRDNGDRGGSGGDNGGAGGNNGDSSDSESGPSTVERAVSVVSVVFTVLLFAFLVWQALQVPADTSPRADITDTERLPDGQVKVTVVLTNPASEGLLSATVEVDCTRPPPSVQFTHVPTDGRQHAVFVCPSGSVANASANVTTWQTA